MLFFFDGWDTRPPCPAVFAVCIEGKYARTSHYHPASSERPIIIDLGNDLFGAIPAFDVAEDQFDHGVFKNDFLAEIPQQIHRRQPDSTTSQERSLGDAGEIRLCTLVIRVEHSSDDARSAIQQRRAVEADQLRHPGNLPEGGTDHQRCQQQYQHQRLETQEPG